MFAHAICLSKYIIRASSNFLKLFCPNKKCVISICSIRYIFILIVFVSVFSVSSVWEKREGGGIDALIFHLWRKVECKCRTKISVVIQLHEMPTVWSSGNFIKCYEYFNASYSFHAVHMPACMRLGHSGPNSGHKSH